MEDVARVLTRERGRFGLGEAVDPDDLARARLDRADAHGVGLDKASLDVIDHGERAAAVEHPVELVGGLGDQLRNLAFHHLRSFEEVFVLQEVGFVREHLLHPQGPLLIPRPRQPQRFVPTRQLNRPRTCVTRERYPEHLEHDALDVVFGLGFGEPERVDLHAVAKAAQLLVGDAVALETDAVPHLGKRAHLAHLFDEARGHVDEERDAADDFRELLRGDLSRVAHGIEHADRGGQAVGQFLHGRRTRFLQVIRAHVDRVPLRDFAHRVGDEVDGESSARFGTEDERAAREVLLHDVVLTRARELVPRHALLVRERDVHRDQPHRRGVDRHRRVHFSEWDVLEERAHLPEVRHRNPDLANLAVCEHVIGVVPGLGREIERDRKTRLAFRQV